MFEHNNMVRHKQIFIFFYKINSQLDQKYINKANIANKATLIKYFNMTHSILFVLVVFFLIMVSKIHTFEFIYFYVPSVTQAVKTNLTIHQTLKLFMPIRSSGKHRNLHTYIHRKTLPSFCSRVQIYTILRIFY